MIETSFAMVDFRIINAFCNFENYIFYINNICTYIYLTYIYFKNMYIKYNGRHKKNQIFKFLDTIYYNYF